MYLVLYENRPLCKILSLLPSFTFVGKSKLLMVLLHHIILKSLYEQLMEKNTLQDWTSTLFYKKQNRQNGNNAKRNTTSLYWQKHIRNDKLSWQNFITHFLFKLANGSTNRENCTLCILFFACFFSKLNLARIGP